MSEMVERVARALATECGIDPDAMVCAQVPAFLSHPRLGVYGAHYKFRDEDYVPAWQYFRSQARVSIRAMREPTGAMIGAGDDAYVASLGGLRAYGGQDGTTVCWRAMADEALK